MCAAPPGSCPFEQPKPADAPTAAGSSTGLETDLKPNGRYRGAEKSRCGDLFPPQALPFTRCRNELATAMSVATGPQNQLLFWRAHIRGEHGHAPHFAVTDKHPAEASAGLFAGNLAGAQQSIITRG